MTYARSITMSTRIFEGRINFPEIWPIQLPQQLNYFKNATYLEVPNLSGPYIFISTQGDLRTMDKEVKKIEALLERIAREYK